MTGVSQTTRGFFCVDDSRRLARRRVPRLVFDFVDGAAGQESAAQLNSEAFNTVKLQPRVLRRVDKRCIAKSFLGFDFGMPFGISPMGMCNLAWPGADRNLAEAAKKFNIPHCVSTAASSSLEDLKKWGKDQTWFQLYVNGPTQDAWTLVDRARAAEYKTLILTVDVPVVSRRVRDLRNGFIVPFKIGLKQFVDFSLHPHWSLSTLFKGIPEPKNFRYGSENRFDRNASRAGANWEFLDALREKWKGNLIVKGIMDTDDASRVQNAGVDAIWVSNHGGRQLDSSPPALSALPKIRNTVGPNMPIIFDSGARNGEDVVKALALGAKACSFGKAYLFALGAGGQQGVEALLGKMKAEINRDMILMGCKSIKDLNRSKIVFRKN